MSARRDPVDRLLAEAAASAAWPETPDVRARVTAVNGTVIDQDTTVAAGAATFNQIQGAIGRALEAVNASLSALRSHQISHDSSGSAATNSA